MKKKCIFAKTFKNYSYEKIFTNFVLGIGYNPEW